MRIETKIWEGPNFAYHGEELRPHFLLTRMGIRGSGVGCWRGPCHVLTENLIDWEDRIARDRIEAKEMLHFLGEFFGISLREGVIIQRLFVCIVVEVLREELDTRGLGSKYQFTRSGNDLYCNDSKKMSVSIVTSSAVSQLLHFGLNIDASGAPVEAWGLGDFTKDGPGVPLDPIKIAAEILERFRVELGDLEWACAKVRPVV